MKKIFVILLFMIGCGLNLLAQQRTDLGGGYTLVNYGFCQVIEDDNNQRTIEIKVEKKQEKKAGEVVYDVFCNNRFVKSVTKGAISAAIKAGLGGLLPSWVIGPAVSEIYDDVCDYFGEK